MNATQPETNQAQPATSQATPAQPATDAPAPLARIAHGALRGVIAAMAMTGLREFTRRVGMLEEPPPEAIVRQRFLGRFRRADRGPQRARVELLHWSYGGGGGAAFAALPQGIRQRAFAGPLYGLLVWLGFELAISPLLGLSQAKRPRPLDRLALVLDHILYGFVLSEGHKRPRH